MLNSFYYLLLAISYFESISIVLATSCFVLRRATANALLAETGWKAGNVYIMNGLGVEMLLGNSHYRILSPTWRPGSISQVLGDWLTFHVVFTRKQVYKKEDGEMKYYFPRKLFLKLKLLSSQFYRLSNYLEISYIPEYIFFLIFV